MKNCFKDWNRSSDYLIHANELENVRGIRYIPQTDTDKPKALKRYSIYNIDMLF